MCGIIAVLRRRSRQEPPPVSVLEQAVATAAAAIARGFDAVHLNAAVAALADLDHELRSVPGMRCLLAAPAAVAVAKERLDELQQSVAAFERTLDQDAAVAADEQLEQRNAALVRLKDALWSVRRDRIPHAEARLPLNCHGSHPWQES